MVSIRRVSSRLLAGALVAVTAGAGCLGMPDVMTEDAEGSALSADGRRMRLIYRNRGWADGREAYELYSKVPYVSSSSVTVMGMRLALPSKWPDNTPVSLITFDTRWWTDSEMGLAIYHRAEGTTGAWEPLRCNGAVAGSEMQYFHASQALIDLQNGEVELVPVVAAAAGARDTYERDDAANDGSRETPRTVQLQTFAQCGISETNPEFSAFVFPYQVAYWNERFEYDFGATCDGDPCPAYRGDPNEPRRRNNNLGGGANNNNNGGVVNPDPFRASWDITDDSVWQCGRRTVTGLGNVSSVRLEIRGQHPRFGELEATLKKVSGSTNASVFAANSGLAFPVNRSVTTSSELWSGTWELCVRDTVRGDVGRVDGWSITQEGAGAGAGNNGAVQPAGVTSVVAGATRNESINPGESDWFSIALAANQTLTIETSGTACANSDMDTVVSLHSSLPASRPNAGMCPSTNAPEWTSGAYVDCQDQAEVGTASGYCSRLEQSVVSAGTYYIRVFGYDNEDSGQYTVSFQVR